MSDLIYVSCYHCGESGCEIFDNENGFNLVKCRNCGLLYVNPRPVDEEINDASMIGMHRGDNMLKVRTSFDWRKVNKYKIILRDFFPYDSFGDNSSWLDIGCGTGEFMMALQRFSYLQMKVAGSEPNLKKMEICRKYGLDVTEKPPWLLQEQFHTISMLNVYSHLSDPVKTISEWKELLLPGGEILLETGHSCHLPKALHHRPYYLPDHLSFANREIVVSILQRIGFKILDVKIYRGEMYPTDPIEYLKYLGMHLARNTLSMQAIRPREPFRDMFIRAVRI